MFQENKLAYLLTDVYAVRSGDIIPIFVEQSPEWIVAVIATLKSGAAYTPILRDGSYLSKCPERIFDQCKPALVLSDTEIIPVPFWGSIVDPRTVALPVQRGTRDIQPIPLRTFCGALELQVSQRASL